MVQAATASLTAQSIASVTQLNLQATHGNNPGVFQPVAQPPLGGGRALQWSTFDGGINEPFDKGTAVAVDNQNNTYLGGFSRRNDGCLDAWVHQYDINGRLNPLEYRLPGVPGQSDYRVSGDWIRDSKLYISVFCYPSPGLPANLLCIYCFDLTVPWGQQLPTSIWLPGPFDRDCPFGNIWGTQVATDPIFVTSSFIDPMTNQPNLFVASVASDLSSVLHSATVTFTAGKSAGHAISVDAANNMYIGGQLALSPTENGALFLRVNADFMTVAYAFTWNNVVPGSAGAVNGVFVTGTNFYMTGALNNANPTHDHKDLILAKIDTNTANVIYGFRWFVQNGDYGGYGESVDAMGNAFCATSINGPPMGGVADIDGDLTEFSPAGNTIVSDQPFGNTGMNPTLDRDIAVSTVDPIFGQISTAGYTRSPDFDPIQNAAQSTFSGTQDAFVARLTAPF
jgi:hypothetical protein